uniref:Uncharacterized protein n=1 Tax=Oryza glumipatula TaxID=40148 RepID=A0A0D9YUJ6_9ORYZ
MDDASNSSKEAEAQAPALANQAPATAAAAARSAIHRGPMLRLAAMQLMLFAAYEIVGSYAAPPVALPRLFAAFVAWLVGCLSLFVAPP